ncbi:hypothetical protein [Williamsia sp. CHRR-6]|uniref:hypothetical protein n=1 Tax=Williamsia sp. CHRR-6 TaxID=2835871 RepID=UPI001BDABEEB|nr:hypothetical protein [Williamsia sp. CHRR-6]MBT0567371.1 hypothetical protein [Williamsia sp. CHRR-6]
MKRFTKVLVGVSVLGLLLAGCRLTGLEITPSRLQCRVVSQSDGKPLFDGGNQCGTAVASFGVPFGFGSNGAQFRLAAPQTRTGSGTATDPLVITTELQVADQGVNLTQVDTFVDGATSYDTTITVSTFSTEIYPITVYRAADCAVGGDNGTGALVPNGVSCVASNGERITWTDLTGGATRQEGAVGDVFAVIGAGKPFDNTASTVTVDNAAGLSWTVNIPPSPGSLTLKSRFTYESSGTGS